MSRFGEISSRKVADGLDANKILPCKLKPKLHPDPTLYLHVKQSLQIQAQPQFCFAHPEFSPVYHHFDYYDYDKHISNYCTAVLFDMLLSDLPIDRCRWSLREGKVRSISLIPSLTSECRGLVSDSKKIV